MKTVRVRIAVRINKEGQWRANSSSETYNTFSGIVAAQGLEIGEVLHWIEADVPIPEEPKLIVGEVTAE